MRTKSTLKTFLYGIFFTTIIAILGLIKTKLLLQYLGDEYVGIYQLFYQIYLYLSIVDGGVGASVTFRLFKPVNEKNYDKINSIMEASRRYFNKIGIIVILLGFLISFEIMFFIKETTIDSLYIKICFILYIIASAVSYFTTSHAFLFESEQKLYKSSNLNHSLSILESVAAIVIASLGGKLLTILISFVILSILRNVVLYTISKKEHKYLAKPDKIDDSFKKDANNLIVNKISNLVLENSNLIFVSKYLGLTYVTIFSAYNQIVTMIKLMIQRLNSALFPSVGNMLVDAKEKAKDVFNELNSLLFFMGNILFVALYFTLTPFISLWYGENYTANNIICLLFVAILYLNIIKIPLESYVKASGNFNSIKKSSIFQAILCLVLSMLLVKKCGISGVLFATFISTFVGVIFVFPKIIYKKIIDDKLINYFLKFFKYSIGLVINFIIIYYLEGLIPANSLVIWFLKGALIFGVSTIINYIYFYVVKELVFMERIKYLLKKFIKGKQKKAA